MTFYAFLLLEYFKKSMYVNRVHHHSTFVSLKSGMVHGKKRIGLNFTSSREAKMEL